MLRIAQVAPLYESVPPQTYGGTERVVAYLTDELVRQGHDVTLFASGDSRTSAKLVATCSRALRLDPTCTDMLAPHIMMLDAVFAVADGFDVVHFHIDYLHFPFSRHGPVRHVTTLHGRLDLPGLVPLYQCFRDVPVVSISDAQRLPLRWLNWVRTVYHGLPPDLYHPGPGGGDYLAFLGRISPEKRPDRAIDIAERAGIPLKISAKIDNADYAYFKDVIEKRLRSSLVEFVGEVGEGGKQALLGDAMGLLFPIDWPEPFGLVMIEAMACGTPVIAYPHGSVPEIITEGENGFIVRDTAAAVRAVSELGHLSRQRCRAIFEARFLAERMAQDYLGVYEELGAHPRDHQPNRVLPSTQAGHHG